MSLIPMLMEFTDELDAPDYRMEQRYWDDDFGFGIHPMDIVRPRLGGHRSMMLPMTRRRLAPYDRLAHVMHRRMMPTLAKAEMMRDMDLKDLPVVGKDGFQMCIDVSQFKPNELNVKTVNNMVVVEGKHEERQDDCGLITRHFVRKYALPKNYDPKDLVSTLSSDGVLTVSAPKPKQLEDKSNERIIQIQQTGPAHLNVKPAEPSTQKQQQQQQQQQQTKANAMDAKFSYQSKMGQNGAPDKTTAKAH